MRLNFDIGVSTLVGHSHFNDAAEHRPIANTDVPCLYSSGCSGLTTLTIPLIGEGEPPAIYTVRLGFADVENSTTEQRVFDIKLRDKLAEEDFDIVGAAGGANKAVVREFQGIKINNDLKIELTPKGKRSSTAQLPLLNSIEMVREAR